MIKEVYFEGLQFWYYPHVMFYRIMGWNIYVFDTDLKLKNSAFKRWLLVNKWIKRIISHHYSMGSSHSIAIELANLTVDNMNDNINIKNVCELYGDNEVLLVFKRSLAGELAILTSIHNYLNNRIMKYGNINSRFHFYPGKTYKYLLLIKNLGLNIIFLSSVKVINKARIIRFIDLIKDTVKFSLICMLYLTHLMVQLFFHKAPSLMKKYKYCISVSSAFWVKFDGPRKFTYLVDDEKINSKDTLFLFEYAAPDSVIKKNKREGYNNYLMPPGTKNTFQNIFKRSVLKPNSETKILIKLIINPWQYTFVINGVICLLLQRLRWGVVSEKFQFNNYIYTNKENISQIANNILFRKQNTKSWQYMQFVGGQYQVDNESTPFDERNVYWSYLNSDYFLLNNQAMVSSMRKHHQQVRNYKIIGNIFSDMIALVNKKMAIDKIFQLSKYKSQQKIIISIFDTSYVDIDVVYSNFEEGIKFLEDMKKLANLQSKITFIFKPSKDDSYFIDGSFVWSSSVKGKKLVSLRKELCNCNNVIMLNDNYDPVEVIAISNIVITDCFSSPTADALSAGISAFWYDAMGYTYDYPLDKISGAVIHEYDDLLNKISDILFNDGITDVREQSMYSSMIDENNDRHGLNYFRALLICNDSN